MAHVMSRQDQLAMAAELLAALRMRVAGGDAAATTSSEELMMSSGRQLDEHFMMYEFKVGRCPFSRAHEWTSCPYAHPGEAARRRDPRRVAYAGEPCPDFRARPGGGGGASCPRGADCPFAHGTFETWLHPSRYRTRPCRAGAWCARPICFFAHNDKELRILGGDAAAAPTLSPRSPWDYYSPPLSPTEGKRQLQAPVQQQGGDMGMDVSQVIFAMQQIKARKAMGSVAPRTAATTLPKVMVEDELELGWVSEPLM